MAKDCTNVIPKPKQKTKKKVPPSLTSSFKLHLIVMSLIFPFGNIDGHFLHTLFEKLIQQTNRSQILSTFFLLGDEIITLLYFFSPIEKLVCFRLPKKFIIILPEPEVHKQSHIKDMFDRKH